MGENESLAVSPNGLLPGKAASVTRHLDAERWSEAEDVTAKLIACIQPNPPSENRRNAVARYVRRLIMECFPPLQVEIFTFGSVPLKTYLPDGDIDLTAFSTNQSLKDSWANLVRDMLEKEEKNQNAEFRVKEVQYIQAEVKLIKCLVENIVVDISFNQIGGLCTLCFLEEADLFINQNHLFKRSIILIKAWCYYESRILGAHHGLISTYALETLVLYIFHVFNNSFSGPLEVLYRFLEFFSKFDWQNFCISLWGPVPVSSLPDVTAEPPRKDVGELGKSQVFLKDCSRAYAVNPVAQETQGHPFVAKHFNVIDPLRENNNLGRSVSKGNFFRIRSAFALGAKKLARLLECPKENLIHEVNHFFMNTWERHGSGRRPDAPGNDLWLSRLGDPEPCLQAENGSNSSSSKRNQSSAPPSMPSRQKNGGTEVISKTTYQTQKNCGNSYQLSQEVGSNQNASNGKLQQTVKPEIMVNNFHGRHLFARTRSSPELTDTCGEALLPARRSRASEAGKRLINSTRADSIKDKNLESESLSSSIRNAADSSSVRHTPSPRSPDSTVDMSSAVNSYCDDLGSVSVNEEFSATGEQGMQQEEQDLVNSITYVTGQGFNGHFPFPFNFSTGPHLPFQMTPAVLASMGYGHRNVPGIVPSNIPFMETPWSTNMQFPQNFVSPPFTHYFPGGSHPMSENLSKSGNEEMGSLEVNVEDSEHDNWNEQERGAPNFRLENGGYDKHHSSSTEHSFAPSGRKSRSTRVDDLENSHPPVRGSQIQSEERNAGSRSVSCAMPPGYLQGRLPWDGLGRPLAYTNGANQLMTYGPRLVPVAPVSTRPPNNIYPRYANETPRYRSGTGTYFPNPRREQRPTSGMRRGNNYGHDRNNDHQSEREGNWNGGSKARASGRSSSYNNRNQVDNNKPRQDHRSDRQWVSSSYRHESSSYSSHQPPMRSQDASGNVAYSIYRLPHGMKQNSEGHNPPPSAMMFYPYDQNNSVDEAPHLNDGNHSAGGEAFEDQQPRYRRGSHTDDPSSPRFPRGK
ncbi:unnamed protein product [Eruca vesicaria subsp. sativa]|uniref:Polymerase nucleotidyl transferase domain-containing protein n=1 Tax=Eruca vesicaria subsp. sativa TaxID=29727 RepID=A0ABC8JQZ8_ERUVS|nr:unnamed protein product [Eruca vesicaria subsp. sativa]